MIFFTIILILANIALTAMLVFQTEIKDLINRHKS